MVIFFQFLRGKIGVKRHFAKRGGNFLGIVVVVVKVVGGGANVLI